MKLNKSEIKEISYNYETNKMQIFNKRGLLLFDKFVSEDYYFKCVNKLYEKVTLKEKV